MYISCLWDIAQSRNNIVKLHGGARALGIKN